MSDAFRENQISWHGFSKQKEYCYGAVVDLVAIDCSQYFIIAFITKEEKMGPENKDYNFYYRPTNSNQ